MDAADRRVLERASVGPIGDANRDAFFVTRNRRAGVNVKQPQALHQFLAAFGEGREDLAGLGVTDINFSNSFGLAGDIGLSVNLGKSFHINGDIKYIQIQTDADIKVGSDTLDKVKTDINPWVFGLGVGFRF